MHVIPNICDTLMVKMKGKNTTDMQWICFFVFSKSFLQLVSQSVIINSGSIIWKRNSDCCWTKPQMYLLFWWCFSFMCLWNILFISLWNMCKIIELCSCDQKKVFFLGVENEDFWCVGIIMFELQSFDHFVAQCVGAK